MDKTDFARDYNYEWMGDAAPEEPAATAEPAPAPERTWGEATQDVIGNTVGALADGKRGLAVLAAGLDAGLNTNHFQQQKNRMAYEYAQNQRAQEKHDLAMRSGNFELAEAQKDVPVKDARRAADIAAQKLRLARLDRDFRDQEFVQIDKNLRDRIAVDPQLGQQWAILSEQEKNAVMSSPALRQAKEFHYIVRDLLRSRNDPDAWRRFKDLVERYEGRVVDDGKGNYTAEIFGQKIPINEESGMAVQQLVRERVAAELNARTALSPNATEGNAIGMMQAHYMEKMLTFVGNDAAQAQKIFRNTVSTLSPEQKLTMMSRFILEKYLADPSDMGTLQAIQSLVTPDAFGMTPLKRMGYDARIDEENPINSQIVRRYPDGSILRMSLPAFLEHLKERDTGSRLLETQIEGMKQEAARKIRMENAKEIALTARALGKNKAPGGSGEWPGGDGEENGQGQAQEKIDDQSFNLRVDQYGSGFNALEQREQVRVDKALDRIDTRMIGKGYARRGPNGKIQIDIANIPDGELTTAVQMEVDAFKGTKLDENMGYYHMVRDYRQAAADEARLMAESKKVQKELRLAYANSSKYSPKFVPTMPPNIPGGTPMMPVAATSNDVLEAKRSRAKYIYDALAKAREEKSRLGKKLGIKEKNLSTNGK